MITPLRAAAHLLTRDKVRRIAANIAPLPDSSPGRPASRKNLKPCCLRGAFRACRHALFCLLVGLLGGSPRRDTARRCTPTSS
jgi:hypothetical protein